MEFSITNIDRHLIALFGDDVFAIGRVRDFLTDQTADIVRIRVRAPDGTIGYICDVAEGRRRATHV